MEYLKLPILRHLFILLGSFCLLAFNYLVGIGQFAFHELKTTSVALSILDTFCLLLLFWYLFKIKEGLGNFLILLIAMTFLILATLYCYFLTFAVFTNFCCAP